MEQLHPIAGSLPSLGHCRSKPYRDGAGTAAGRGFFLAGARGGLFQENDTAK